MWTTIDRYLLNRFWHAFFVLFVASMGLFAVIDGFTNLDAFQKAAEASSANIVVFILQYYLYQTSPLFDLLGPTLATFSVMAVVGLMIRFGEVHPLLAAGVPTYRLARPLLFGVLLINALLFLNQEAVIPRIQNELQAGRNTKAKQQRINPTYDQQQRVLVSGRQFRPERAEIVDADFFLSSVVCNSMTPLKASSARYVPPRSSQPGGWRLVDVTPAFEKIPLTELGKTLILPGKKGDELFVITDITPDDLSRRATSHQFLPLTELIDRIRFSPGGEASSTRLQILAVHNRLLRPLLNVVGVFMVIPLLIRRERYSLVGNVAICMAYLAAVIGVDQAAQFAGKVGFIPMVPAVWASLVFGGTLCAWLSPCTRT